MIKLVYPEFWSKSGVLSYLLMPFSWIYIFLGSVRKFFVKPVRLAGIVICIGNISVGGAGKTQIVSWLARQLTRKKINFLIVTKGYGSSLRGAKYIGKTDLASEVGDESILLKDYGPVLAAKNIKAALPVLEKIKPDVIIFDDGLQNPGFIKDFNILTIDADRTVGNGRIFPAGPLRENVESAISKAGIVTVIGNQFCRDIFLISNIVSSGKPFFKAKIKLNSKVDLGRKYYAFTAIGNPDRFYDLLEKNGLTLVKTKSFPDHHNYTCKEVDILKTYAKKHNYSLITTKKDYVKILDGSQIVCANVELNFEYEKKLFSLIYEELCKKS